MEPVAGATAFKGELSSADHAAKRYQSMWQIYVQRFLRHRLAAAGLVVLVLIVLSAILAPYITQDPNALSASERKAGPSSAHWLGTDEAGRDIIALLT